MLRLFIVRHGETDWNQSRRIMGREPIALNAAGDAQAVALGEALQPLHFDAAYTSPALRAFRTAELLVEGRELSLQPDERLWEIDYGEWVGKYFEEVRAMPDYVPYFRRLETPVAPGGETLHQVRDRSCEFFEELKRESASDRNILVVSHADWIKCFLMHLLEIPFQNIGKFRIDNASLSLVESDELGDRVVCLNQRGDFERLFTPRRNF